MEDRPGQTQGLRPESVQVRSRLSVRVQPRASSTSVVDCKDGTWKIRLTAPPVDNAANEALIEFLSQILKLPKRSLTIVHGLKGREKIIEVAGRTDEEIRDLLRGAPDQGR